MPTNNILLFDQNKGNMMGDEAYSTNTQRLNGVQTGIANSQLQNKFQYQVSLVAYAIASLMYNNGLDANDANAVSAFVSSLSGTLVQKVLDKASTSDAQNATDNTKWMTPLLVSTFFTYMHAAIAEAQAGTNDTKWMSPLQVKNFYNAMKASQSDAQAGTNDTDWMSPLQVKNFYNYMQATQSDAQAGTNNTDWMSPLQVMNAISYWWNSASVDSSKLPIIPVSKGGTNKTSWTNNGILFANSASSLSQLTVPSEDSVVCQNANSIPYTMPNIMKVCKLGSATINDSLSYKEEINVMKINSGTYIPDCYMIIYIYRLNFVNLKASSTIGSVSVCPGSAYGGYFESIRADNTSTSNCTYNKSFILNRAVNTFGNAPNVGNVVNFEESTLEISLYLNSDRTLQNDFEIDFLCSKLSSGSVSGTLEVYGIYPSV